MHGSDGVVRILTLSCVFMLASLLRRALPHALFEPITYQMKHITSMIHAQKPLLMLYLETDVFVFIVTRSEIRCIQAARNNPQSTMSRKLE